MFKRLRGVLAAACFSALAVTPLVVQAQSANNNYPNRTITFVVPYPAGGATDTLARMLAQKMSEAWKVPVMVDNRAGAGGTIGNNYVVKAEPNGYTVLIGITALVQQLHVMDLPYTALTDLAPVMRIASSPSILAVPPSIPANSVQELVALIKANPEKHSYGSFGQGTTSHFQGAAFALQENLDIVHVPYKGGAPLVAALMGDQVTLGFLDAGSSRAQLPKFKLLGVSGENRLSWLPDVPTLKEQGLKNYEPLGWFGMFMPAGTPKAIQEKFAKEASRILAEPEVTKRVQDLGLIVGGETLGDFGQILKNDTEVWGKIVKDAKITLQ